MYLLNHLGQFSCTHPALWFTFHYVSIKSVKQWTKFSAVTNLHSTMYLLNRCQTALLRVIIHNLHSTMYLLNLWLRHTVIKSLVHLHSTMYLLNLRTDLYKTSRSLFTFHYVSIKSSKGRPLKVGNDNLHSTMYLLNQVRHYQI